MPKLRCSTNMERAKSRVIRRTTKGYKFKMEIKMKLAALIFIILGLVCMGFSLHEELNNFNYLKANNAAIWGFGSIIISLIVKDM